MATGLPRIPRIRTEPVPTGALVVVVRGHDAGAIDAQQATDFRRRFSDWQWYGLSAYYAETPDAIDALAEGQLERFAFLLVYDPVLLIAQGVEVVPTFRKPHVTLAFRNLEAGLLALGTVKHEQIRNKYHEA